MPRALASLLLLLLSAPLWAQPAHPILALDSPAPDFALPGVDGKVHELSDYAGSPVLVVIFTCNHCPIAQMYERRIEQLYAVERDPPRGEDRGGAAVPDRGLRQRALARAGLADHPQRLAALELERDMADRVQHGAAARHRPEG